MADLKGFRALRYDPAAVDLSRVVAPPYDVISPELQRELYARDPRNIVRVEYAEGGSEEGATGSRYALAASALSEWRRDDALIRDERSSLYPYRLTFEHEGMRYSRRHLFGVVRLEPWSRGIVKPHEHTRSAPKSDRLSLLRATRTQVSPVYCLYRPPQRGFEPTDEAGETLYRFEADGQDHELGIIRDPRAIEALTAFIDSCDLYVADGHHRYETALAYRDERLKETTTWTNAEAENFVLMALTAADDPGLLVLPTHRLVHRTPTPEGEAAITAHFDAAR
jgi:uncharacterized protein (DUF1015 family)